MKTYLGFHAAFIVPPIVLLGFLFLRRRGVHCDIGLAVGIFQVRSLEKGFATAEWGFAIGSPFWGTGIFEQSAALIMEFAFERVRVHRLEAGEDVEGARAEPARSEPLRVRVDALCALEEALEGIDLTRLDHYVGVSAGSFVAAGLANGISPASVAMAYSDWLVHLAVSPAKQAELAASAFLSMVNAPARRILLFNRLSREQMTGMMRSAGFADVTQHPMTFGVCVCYRGIKR